MQEEFASILRKKIHKDISCLGRIWRYVSKPTERSTKESGRLRLVLIYPTPPPFLCVTLHPNLPGLVAATLALASLSSVGPTVPAAKSAWRYLCTLLRWQSGWCAPYTKISILKKKSELVTLLPPRCNRFYVLQWYVNFKVHKKYLVSPVPTL